ncbi:MAG: rubrerythrin family protein [Methanobacteriaceae archaeon]|jgi:rubrerythrin|nr:rubrerythrin family protein [Methanobacteriaceae archaeon]OPY24547.1 MAG: Rubrerythrin [Methanobacterium sp. PtaU1.Bin097]HNS26314.1 rubrerythrin family protein [Methanobacteriaceae archaeon]
MEKTLENLTKAFIGESQARNRYTFYSKQATAEGYPQISEIFLETADNEREHAKWLFKMIQDLKEGELDEIEVGALSPLTLGTTVDNLRAAIAGEHYENSEMYPEFADVAEEEGLIEVSDRLWSIAHAEEHHEDRYKKLLEQVEAGTLFGKKEEVEWTCIKCGYTYKGTEPPAKCPACDHARIYFKLYDEKY